MKSNQASGGEMSSNLLRSAPEACELNWQKID